MKLWQPDQENEKFEMTPMIDVVFLLITFFMTVTSFANAEMIQVVMPLAPDAKVPEEMGNRQFISITAEGEYWLGAHRSTPDEIYATLTHKANEKDFKGIYLRADATTPHRYISEIMKKCAEAGVYNVIFGTLKE